MDPLTELPPPSRFDPEDLQLWQEEEDDGASHQETLPLPAPFLVWSPNIASNNTPLRPQMLLICFSKPSCTLLHHIPGKKLVASVVLPEISMADNTVAPSVEDRTCCIYALDGELSILAASVQYRIPADRSHEWVKTLFKSIRPESTLVVGLIQVENFRSMLSIDEPAVFMLETDKCKQDQNCDHEIAYLPSGSLVDGPAAAVLSYCQMRALPARMILSWPEQEVRLLGSTLQKLLNRLPASRTIGFAQASKASVGKRGISSYELFM